MNNSIPNWIAVPLLALGISAPSHASVTCLAPDPACAAVLLGGLVTSIVSGNEDRELRHLQAGRERAALEAIVEEIENTDDRRLAIRIRDAARYRPGFSTIVNRFEEGRHEGRLSLESLMNFDPQLFDDLDRIATVVGQHYPDEVMIETYGPKRLHGGEVNWERYAILAREALAIHHNFFVNGE